MSGELAPIGPEMARRNRRLIAQRTPWPEGAIEICEQVEKAHPDWDVFWREENRFRGFEAPAGFYATPRRFVNATPAYGLNADSLSAAILALSSSCPECGTRLPVPPGSTPPSHRDGTGPCQVPWTQATRAAS